MGRVTDLMMEAGGGKIPQEAMKRATIRKGRNIVGTSISKAKKEYNLDPNNIVGWFSNKHNKAEGWLLYELNPTEKKEFGASGVYRTFTDTSGSSTGNMAVVKIDIKKGTYAFVDNKHYTETDKVKFEKMTAYDRVVIEPTEKGFREFNIV